jgi:succinoglycan biosynthesis transport protein ExoP
MSPETRAGSSTITDRDDSGDESLDLSKLRHYLRAPIRRPLLVLVPWIGIIGLSVAAYYALPKRYKSSTLILVESDKVPDSFVARVATEDRGQRLWAIKPEILSRTRLEKVLEETNPYPEIASTTTAVERLRRRIAINITGNDGFTIEFVHNDPHKAQEVANRVATLFMEETIKAREEQVEGAVDFLATQVADARREVEKKDAAVRSYRESRMGTLPEQLEANLATMQMLQQERRTVEENLVLARDKRDALARGGDHVARITTPGQAPSGPDDLDELRRQLSILRSRYTDQHPDVQSLQARVARLEARARAADSAVDSGDEGPEGASSIVREQLARAKKEIVKLEARLADLEQKIATVRSRVEATPRTEQELTNLARDYGKLNDNYLALLSKQLEAQMAGRLERRWKGDRFRMLDPANLPEEPYFPNPFLIIGLGTVAGLFVGLGGAVAAEFVDPSVKDAQDLESILTHPVLARIPHLPSLGRSTQ